MVTRHLLMNLVGPPVQGTPHVTKLKTLSGDAAMITSLPDSNMLLCVMQPERQLIGGLVSTPKILFTPALTTPTPLPTFLTVRRNMFVKVASTFFGELIVRSQLLVLAVPVQSPPHASNAYPLLAVASVAVSANEVPERIDLLQVLLLEAGL